MPRAKQISAWVDDRPGVLGRLAEALGLKGVSIRAFTAATVDGRGFVRLVVDRPAIARKVLAKHGWETSVDEVVEVTVPDRPGALGAVADRLGAAGVNVVHAYVGTAKSAQRVNLYLAVPDVKAALRALR
jgi:hypothetical protein